MSKFPFAIVGFDLDGTLVDSSLDLGLAVNHALAQAGRPPVPAEDVRHLIGGGARKMLERALDRTGGPIAPDQFDPLFADLLAFYADHITDFTLPYDGCLNALNDLAARGVKLAVCTNKVEALARKLIDQLGMTDRFACILGGDSMGPGRAKPQPDMIEEAIRQCGGGRFAMVGDSSFDTGAARAAQVPSVVLSFGFADMPPEDMGGDAVIDHYRDLVPVLETL